ncbi:MAG: M1 family metallopeptidase [Cytophagaceae bacterium]
MHNTIKFFFILTFLSTIISCQPGRVNKQTVNEANVQEKKSVNAGRPKTSYGPYNPSRTLNFDLIHTKLDVKFDWERQYLNGLATLTFKPWFYPQNTLEVDAKGMEIHYVKKMPSEADLKYTYNGKILSVRLDKEYTRTDTFQILISYTAKPNELPKGGSQAITDDKGLYFINPLGKEPHKPKQIWTQGETESSSCWFPTIDTPNERTTQEMYITVDTAYTVLSNGEMVYSRLNNDGTKTVYWKQILPHAPYLFMMAIGKFAVVEDNMPESRFDWDDLEIKYYVEPEYEKYAKSIFGHTPEMIEFFSDKLNYKFPWNKYSQVVVRDYVSGAMENTTATIFMEALQVDDRELIDENWDGIIAHELFHHWFGDLVTCESWANLPLNESFANYSEYLWIEHKYGVNEADHHAQNEFKQYLEEARNKIEPLIRFRYEDKEDMFDRHSYNKGGLILHMLRKHIGEDAFFNSLSLYLKKHQFTSVEVHDLRMAFEEITGQDLNWFFNQWFLSPGHPKLKITDHYSSGILTLKIDQLQDTLRVPVYQIPVTVDIWINGIKDRRKIKISRGHEEILLPVPAKPQLVVIDPDKDLLAEINHEKSEEEYIYQFEISEKYILREEALSKLFEHKGKASQLMNSQFNKSEITNMLHKGLNDPFWVIREYCLEQFFKYPIPQVERFLPIIEKMAIGDPKSTVRAKAIMFLSAYNNQKYVNVYSAGLNERAYSIVAASLSAYLTSGQTLNSDQMKEFESLDNVNIIAALADYYISNKDLSKFQWFKNKMVKADDRSVYALISYFTQYVNLLEGGEREEGIQVLKSISKNNNHEVIRSTADYFIKMLETKK